MNILNFPKLSPIALAVLMGASWVFPVAAQSAAPPKTDNTAENKRDRAPGAATADQQKNNASDTDITAKIRRSIMADKTMSTYARNVKIISQAGVVTLKGPVRSVEPASK